MRVRPVRAHLRRHWRTFGAGAALLVSMSVVALGALVFRQHDIDQRMRENVERSYVLRSEMQHVFSLLQDIETGARGFTITGDAAFLQPYNQAKGDLPAELDLLQQGAASAEEQAYYARLTPLVRQKLKLSADIVALARADSMHRAAILVGTGRGKQVMDEIRGVLGQWQDHERRRLSAHIAAARVSSEGLTLALTALSAAVCVLLLMAAVGATLVLRESARVASKLAKSRDEAEAANAAKSAFLAMMSHELRTPLNGVLGMTHALSMTPLDARQRSHLEVIGTSGRSLLLILNDILDLSKIEAGKLDVEAVPFGLIDLLQSVVALWRPPAAERGLALSLDLAPDVPGWATGDPTRLRQVITNLLSNAVKFTDRGSIVMRVRHSKGGRLSFDVIDTGAGIPSDVQSRLFTDFSQADSSTSRRFGGTGLGLSIARKLCRLMGGDLIVSSTEGVGSTFCGSVVLGASEARIAEAGPCEIEIPFLRVLVVDDNAANRAVAEALLGALGMTVTLANDGLEALSVLRCQAADLVLMDVNMPVMNGVDALQAIRSGQAGDAGVPVLALTADAMVGDRERYLSLGFDDHLAKPIEPAALVHALGLAARASGRHDRPAATALSS